MQKPGIKFDFGGIGKGFAVDEAFNVLQEFGLQSTSYRFVVLNGRIAGNVTRQEMPRSTAETSRGIG